MVPRPFTFASWSLRLAAGAGLAIACALLAVALGEQPLSFREALEPGSVARELLVELRLPRVALAALVGAALASAGAVLQALLRNPLADPFVLGVSGGAAVGATAALAFGFSISWLGGLSAVSFAALCGAAGTTFLVMALGRAAGGDVASSTMLIGVVLNSVALALVLLFKVIAAPERLGAVVYWLVGAIVYQAPATLAGASLVASAAILVMAGHGPVLNVLLLGDDDAQSLGVDVRAARRRLFAAASVAVAIAVSLSGLVGFVGLLVPHLVRTVVGEDQRLVVPLSAFVGAAFLMLADLCARLLFRALDQELPVGVVTALLGGPLFVALLVRRRRVAGR